MPVPALSLDVQSPIFAATALPKTMGLATTLQAELDRELSSPPGSWPFEDRVLVSLVPALEHDVVFFHANRGGGIDSAFRAHQLEHLDNDLHRELKRRLRSKRS